MKITDPIADMLTRIRNANSAGKAEVSMPTSKELVEIARVIKRGGLHRGLRGGGHQAPEDPRYHAEVRQQEVPASSAASAHLQAGPAHLLPGKDELPRVLGGLGTAVISTSKGMMCDRDARKLGVGGEVIAYIW
jgi:small subunit ribosomal protein S8